MKVIRENKEQTISEIIEEVTDEICRFYCKWPDKWDEEKEGTDLSESTLCKNCPLGRLS